MDDPPPYADVNPPFPLSPDSIARLRPIAEFPYGHYVLHRLAWQHDGRWLGMWGGWDAELGRFRADVAMHRTNALAGTPTHWVGDV